MPNSTTNLGLKKAVDADNAEVYLVTDLAGSLDTVDALFVKGTAAARPAAGTARRFYLATDTGVLSFDDGTNWHNLAKAGEATIVAADIANDTITATQIAANAVGSSELADGAVDTAAIVDGAVTSAKIADATIATGDLADGAVTS